MRSEKLAITAVGHVSKALAIEMREGRDCGAIDDGIREYTLVDAVVVPHIVRGHLICPGGYSSIRITGEEGCGPFVIAGPLRRIPRSRVAGAVINQVKLRIIRVPAPRRAA